jgi:heme-degrading monooxygenase HmoA
MTARARVLIWHRTPADDPEAIRKAYDEISGQLAGTPGLLGNELLASTADPATMLVMSEWQSLAAFQAWESGVDHRSSTSPLRPYQDRERARFFEIFEVAAEF